MRRFDNERRLGTGQTGHIEFELGISEWPGFRRYSEISAAPSTRTCNLGAFDGPVGLVRTATCSKARLPEKPGLGIDLAREKNLRCLSGSGGGRLRCRLSSCGRREMQRALRIILDDGAGAFSSKTYFQAVHGPG